jgi:hypothetical protein
MKPEGLITVSGITLADGSQLPTQKAVDYGWIAPAAGRQPRGWGLERHELVVGTNLFLDQGRQILCYCFGFRSPISNYTIQNFGVGTGLTPAKVTDVALQAPVTLSNGQITKAIDSIDFISPFTLRVAFTLGVNDANGYILSEMGLFSGGLALIARKVRAVSVNKTSDFAPAFVWRCRFLVPFLIGCASLAAWA